MRTHLIVLLFLLGGKVSCSAADTSSFKYPQIILVQLNTEQSRINAMNKAGKTADAAEIEHDARMVQEKMIADFTANLHYCPVYYFMDTNETMICKKMFANILLDAKGDVIKKPPLNSNSTDYAIVYFGHYLSQSKRTRVVTDSTEYTYDPETPPGKALVMLNDKMQQISYTCYLGYYQPDNNKAGFYSSRKYDIQYFPLAKTLERQLNSKRRKKTRNHYRIKPAMY